jgi:tRNA C32,U32 (ribose-2'-O)-methylase TrmJ
MKRNLVSRRAPPVGRTPAVVLIDPKYPHNVGAALRAASAFGVGQVFFTGERMLARLDGARRVPREERMRGYGSVDLISFDRPFDVFPSRSDGRRSDGRRSDGRRSDGQGTSFVAVELVKGAVPLNEFQHPENAVYVFGPEDGGLPQSVRALCHQFVVIPAYHCLNLAAAVYVTLYARAEFLYTAYGIPMPRMAEARGDRPEPPFDSVQVARDLDGES